MRNPSDPRLLTLSAFLLLAAGCEGPKTGTFRLMPPSTGVETAPAESRFPSRLRFPEALHVDPYTRWEYKVVRIEKDGEEALTQLLNDYAGKGWEFGGQVETKDKYLVLKRAKPPRDVPLLRDLPRRDGSAKGSTPKETSRSRRPPVRTPDPDADDTPPPGSKPEGRSTRPEPKRPDR